LRVLFDSSVIVPALSGIHPHHARAVPWMRRAISGRIRACASLHSLAECFNTLTRLPLGGAASPAEAWALLRENVVRKFFLVSLGPAGYEAVLARMADSGLGRALVYDALHAEAARIAKAERILTFDVADFARVAPDFSGRILEP